MKKLILLSMLFIANMLAAQKLIEIKLWPEGAPNSNGMTKQEKDGVLYVAEPTLTVYPAQNGNGLAIIMCPGGGYGHLAMNHEGHDMAGWFNTQGITYAVLTYRMPNGHNEIPLSDAQQAMRIMRQHAQEWNIRKLGIMGASAGGHLASTVATHFTDAETRPDFQILFYPVITMDPTYTHMGSRQNLLGNNPDKELETKYCNEKQITAETPQAFIMHSSDDGAVPVANSVNYYMELVKNKVPATLHTYPVGGHGWGFRDTFPYKRQWTGELEKWLREINK
ncbi:alpha/beta hydrolase [uncultured Bacteroides sp.]|uniref:alpha/beta hydrolase n=1 Tax=uncultured Bacteroides sp. TaxID=162156 RepID=UPI00261A9EFF|nr:alpha/beta hydrolase [uncultured Bacteroides sp.]